MAGLVIEPVERHPMGCHAARLSLLASRWPRQRGDWWLNPAPNLTRKPRMRAVALVATGYLLGETACARPGQAQTRAPWHRRPGRSWRSARRPFLASLH